MVSETYDDASANAAGEDQMKGTATEALMLKLLFEGPSS